MTSFFKRVEKGIKGARKRFKNHRLNSIELPAHRLKTGV